MTTPDQHPGAALLAQLPADKQNILRAQQRLVDKQYRTNRDALNKQAQAWIDKVRVDEKHYEMPAEEKSRRVAVQFGSRFNALISATAQSVDNLTFTTLADFSDAKDALTAKDIQTIANYLWEEIERNTVPQAYAQHSPSTTPVPPMDMLSHLKADHDAKKTEARLANDEAGDWTRNYLTELAARVSAKNSGNKGRT